MWLSSVLFQEYIPYPSLPTQMISHPNNNTLIWSNSPNPKNALCFTNIVVVVLWFLRFDLSHFKWNFWQKCINANAPLNKLMTIFHKNCLNCLHNYICFVLIVTLILFTYSVHDLKNVNKLQFYQIYYLKKVTKLSKNAKLP